MFRMRHITPTWSYVYLNWDIYASLIKGSEVVQRYAYIPSVNIRILEILDKGFDWLWCHKIPASYWQGITREPK